MTNPRISFGIIVLNGDPFVKYCLRSIYPYAYEIIVVEGGHEDAKSVCTSDGHSIDGTVNSLSEFKKEEDPENKVKIITKTGFWEKRDELGRDRTPQSRAYAEIATGDYLWQVDIDEFYCAEDMEKIIKLLSDDPTITVLSFTMLNFYARPGYLINGWKFKKNIEVYRVFKWQKDYRYVTHEPPTVFDENGIDLRKGHWINGKTLLKKYGISMYHYCHLFPWQVWQKIRVYEKEKPESHSGIIRWAEESYFSLKKPYSVERYYWLPSWLERYKKKYPLEVKNMMEDILSGKVQHELRRTEDIETLLCSFQYRVGKKCYALLFYLDQGIFLLRKLFVGAFKRLFGIKELKTFIKTNQINGNFFIRFFR
ncbi:MAG: glycosyltransferase family A protein [Anaerolineaceae bacterium]|nr:glycosyltransferase family A protein [Anaerolineaceae bacterium]